MVNRRYEAQWMGKGKDILLAVSYTHLDVYKRQDEDAAGTASGRGSGVCI